ncbi:uracil-DNA glycosylase [Desulfosporosinus orientis DSM 765]|uniref:Uracil-DNA glycosylase n=1 Tax=Desulfosporosinus orientis (strain ATCC 19365 / DSM 765 / NCIMB 8382 / VKM B-1628 / Singapore I) TaxID=768706 RepID=G7W7H8_DESOD|nr:uracil-DNA glycosylase [Desulfosporosinus orientis]AET65897.1 uracil-DNA glycosylase [Desulfosporosinus orientis DSM 765]
MAVQADWKRLLDDEIKKDYYVQLLEWVKNEYRHKQIFPKKEDVFNALVFTSYENTKVVILGQDPYPNVGQGMGLSFSVNIGVPFPKSLQNIFQELQSDLGCQIPKHGSLKKWAEQGVLLLNTSLTVEARKPNSHQNKGWEIFTDKIISLVNDKPEPVVFILWGNNARSKKKLITNQQHFIIESPHPSPLSASRGFFGSKPFSRTNQFLIANKRDPIDWQID